MSCLRVTLFLCLFTFPIGADEGESTADVLYPRLEERGISVLGHMKAEITFLGGPQVLYPYNAKGYLVTAAGPYFGLPPRAYFCDERFADEAFSPALPTLCEPLPGLGWQVREMILFQATARRFTIAGDDHGILNLLKLTLSEHPTGDFAARAHLFKMDAAMGRYEIVTRPNQNGDRREMWFDMSFAKNPFRRRGICSRLIAAIGLRLSR